MILDADRVSALAQYNLAIRNLLGPLERDGNRGVDVCFIACILSASFEVGMFLLMGL